MRDEGCRTLGRFRRGPKVGRIVGRWRLVLVPRANARRERHHVERFRYRRQRSRSKSETVLAANLRHDQMAPEQQKSRHSSTSGRFDFKSRAGHESVRRRAIDLPFRCRVVRIFGRRVSGSFRIYLGRFEIHRRRRRHVEDDAAGERFVAEIDAYFEKQARKSARKLRGFSWKNCRSWRRVCSRERVDADLFRIVGAFEGAEESHSKSVGECVRVHRQSDRTARRLSDAFKQLESARKAKQSVHDGGYSHRRGNVRAVHRLAGADERVPSAGDQRPKWRFEILGVLVRIHRRDGEGLHLRHCAFN